jgi:hypothetical protein
VKVLIVAVVLIPVTLATTACAGSHQAVNPPSSFLPTTTEQSQGAAAKVIKSSRLILNGRARCTVLVTASVSAGQPLTATFALHNVSNSRVKFERWYGTFWLVVKTADGATYDTRTPLGGLVGGPISPAEISPGGTQKFAGPSIPVPWKGPLRVTPGCGRSRLPALRVPVLSPGPPRDEATAVADVVGVAGHLFDGCRPLAAGVAVEGEIDAPDLSAPPMRAKCSVRLEPKGRFWVAQALVLVPPDLPPVHIRLPYRQLPRLKRPAPYEAIAWQFVVTKDGATSTGGATLDATKGAARMAPGWALTGPEAEQGRASTSRCGYQGFYGTPFVDFISVCPA